MDEAVYRQEQERVFGRGWIFVGREQRIPRPGDYLTFDEAGWSLIVLRDRDGRVRAFDNTCRHRGTRLLDGRGTVQAIRCPYHDWKYALDGRLRHVPDREGFVALDRGALGLRPVRVETWAGLIFACRDPAAPPLTAGLGTIPEEIAPYGLADMVPIQETVLDIPCNWKAVLDNATESYHLPYVHRASVYRHVQEQPEFRTYGDPYRLTLGIATYGFRAWLDRSTARGGPYSARQLAALHKYVLFPNFLMNVLPYHLTLFVPYPAGPDRCRFFYGFYQRAGARGLEWLRAHATWVASRLILLEDLRILGRFQPGVAAGKDERHRFHASEVALSHYHAVWDRWMAG